MGISGILPSKIIHYYLVTSGIVDDYFETPWPCFTESHPNEPDQLLCIYSTNDVLQPPLMINGDRSDKYGIQFKARGPDREETRSKLEKIVGFLKNRSQVTVDLTPLLLPSYMCHCFDRTSGLLALGPEPQEPYRHVFTVNYLIPITRI